MKKLIRNILKEESTPKTTHKVETVGYTQGEIPNVVRYLPQGWKIYGWEDANNINQDTKYQDKLIRTSQGYIPINWIDGKTDNDKWNKWLVQEYFWEKTWLMNALESWQIASKKTPDELIYTNEEINKAYKNKDIDFSGNAFGMTEVEDKTDKYNTHLNIQRAFDELYNNL